MDIDLGLVGVAGLIAGGVFLGFRLNNRFGAPADQIVNNLTGGNRNVA